MAEMWPAVQLLLVLVAWEIVKFIVERYLRKTVDTEYVTVAHCKDCNGKQRGIETELGDKLSEMKGILVIIALRLPGLGEVERQDLLEKLMR